MSRSYKKPWVKDPANRYMKALYARAYRSHVHIIEKLLRIHPTYGYWEDYQHDLIDKLSGRMPHRREVMGQYDICDFIFYVKYRWDAQAHGRVFDKEYHSKHCRK